MKHCMKCGRDYDGRDGDMIDCPYCGEYGGNSWVYGNNGHMHAFSWDTSASGGSYGNASDGGGCAAFLGILFLISLAGRAVLAMELGVFDTGAGRDLDDAFNAAKRLVQDLCYSGFEHYSYAHRENSATLSARQEIAITALLEQYDRRVRAMLCKNRAFVEALAGALAEKGVLVAADVRAIRESLTITDVAV